MISARMIRVKFRAEICVDITKVQNKRKSISVKKNRAFEGPEKIIDLGIFWKMKNGEHE